MKVFAHRGASAHAPENTLKAIRQAVEQQADGVELDVYQLEDEFILIHDKWLERTTSGQGELYAKSFADLRKLDAGDGEQIPTLAEAIYAIGGQCQLNVEMKGIYDVARLLDYVARHGEQAGMAGDQVLYSSFNHHLLRQIKVMQPEARIGALTACKPLHYAQFAQELQAESVNIDVTFIDQNFIADAKARDLKVMVYTVDQPSELLTLREWGVDAVFSNSPAGARSALATKA